MNESKPKYKRKKKYLSHRIQGSLLAAMVILELLLISLAIIYLYFSFNEILEQQIFSIHRKHQDQTFGLMFWELLKTILVLSLINIIALLTAHVLWSKYVKFVIDAFRNQLSLAGKFMLFQTKSKGHKLHEVIEKLDNWEQSEIERCRKLKELIGELKQCSEKPQSDSNNKKILDLNKAIQELLPLENV